MTWLALAAAVLLAAITALAAPHVLRALPEPVDDPDFATKTPYATLATPRFQVTVGAASFAASLLAFCLLPVQHWLAWAALTGVGALAIAVDAHTTWLPRRLTSPMALLAALGVALLAATTVDPWALVRALGGAAAVGGFFWLFWRLTGGIGYADVRLAAVLGAVTASGSIELTVWAVFLGTMVGAVWGIAHRVRAGRGHFPYGPSLWVGPFAALVLRALLHQT